MVFSALPHAILKPWKRRLTFMEGNNTLKNYLLVKMAEKNLNFLRK